MMPEGECVIWTGHIDRKGYGKGQADGRRGRPAHRIAYEKARGPIPEGMTVDHRCFTPACVNPDHLRLLTHDENRRNQRSAQATHCKHGHEFTPENTYLKKRDGRRQCRACNRDAVRRYKERNAA